jgi:flagellar hook-associated protein 1 FlgK
MRSTFYGYSIAASALQASQAGLDVVGQNIANVNTAGYTRQALEQSEAYYTTGPYQYAAITATVSGQGVSVDSISQLRDAFLDSRYRQANAKLGTQTATLEVLQSVENVLDETQNDGLGVMLADLYAQLETLSGNAGDVEFASLVRSSAQKVVEILGQYADQLSDIRDQQVYDLEVIAGDINAITSKIQELNTAIQNETLRGSVSNTLLDQRNLLLDQLSGYVDITVTQHGDGTLSVQTGDLYLVDAANGTRTEVAIDATGSSISLTDASDGTAIEVTQGSVAGYLKALNGLGGYAAAGEESFCGLAYYQKALDDFAASFADTFNELNKETTDDKPLFAGDSSGVITAATIRISDEWQQDASYITTTTAAGASDGANDNVLRMMDALETETTISACFSGTYDSFATSLIAEIAVDVSYVSDISETQSAIVTAIQNQRDSLSGVSVNEETTNMLMYQKAFSAASRLMTVLDEALDTIINSMGRVGR